MNTRTIDKYTCVQECPNLALSANISNDASWTSWTSHQTNYDDKRGKDLSLMYQQSDIRMSDLALPDISCYRIDAEMEHSAKSRTEGKKKELRGILRERGVETSSQFKNYGRLFGRKESREKIIRFSSKTPSIIKFAPPSDEEKPDLYYTGKDLHRFRKDRIDELRSPVQQRGQEGLKDMKMVWSFYLFMTSVPQRLCGSSTTI